MRPSSPKSFAARNAFGSVIVADAYNTLTNCPYPACQVFFAWRLDIQAAPRRFPQMRLLLVEDNETLSALLEKGLAAAGFAVDAVKSVSEALAALARMRFSAIVLDLGLPDGDGFAVLQALRGKGDPTPVLILTARSAVGDRVKGLMRGADDYLGKPFALEELIARLQALLRR